MIYGGYGRFRNCARSIADIILILRVILLFNYVEIDDVCDTRIYHIGQWRIVSVLEVQVLATHSADKVGTWQQSSLYHTIDQSHLQFIERFLRGGIEYLTIHIFALDQFNGIFCGIQGVDHTSGHGQISFEIIKIRGKLQEHQFGCWCYCGCNQSIKEIRIIGYAIAVAVGVTDHNLVVVYETVTFYWLCYDFHGDICGQRFIAVGSCIGFQSFDKVTDHQTCAAVVYLFQAIKGKSSLYH